MTSPEHPGVNRLFWTGRDLARVTSFRAVTNRGFQSAGRNFLEAVVEMLN